MSIDWDKIKDKPDKPHKILGQTLLDQRRKIRDLEGNLQKKSSELNETLTKLGTSQSKISELDTEVNSLSTSLTTSEQTVSELKLTNTDIQAKNEELNSELSTTKSDIEAKAEKLTQFDKLFTEKDSMISDLHGKIDELNTKVQLKNTEIQQLNQKFEETDSALKTSQANVANIGESKEAQIHEKQQHIEQRDAEIAKLKHQIAELEAGKSKMQAKITELEPVMPEISNLKMDTRITCPMCGGIEIKDVEDKTKVLSYVGHVPLYAKKKICKKCGYEF